MDFADLADVQPKKTYQYSVPHECDSPLMVEHERFTKGSLVEERKWLESAVEVVQAIQEPEDITITDVVFHSRQENAVEPHEHLNIKAAKDVLNSSQKTTVNVSDMPLYMLFRSRFSSPCQISTAYNYTYHLFSKTCSIYRSVASVEYSVYVDQSVIKRGYYIILTLTLHSDDTFILPLVIIYLSSVTVPRGFWRGHANIVVNTSRAVTESVHFFHCKHLRAAQHDLRTRNFRGL